MPPARIGQAAGLSSTARQVGSAIGVATLTAVLSATLSLTLPNRLDHSAAALPAPRRAALAEAIRASPAAGAAIIRALPTASRAGVQSATTSSLSLGTRLAALLAALPIAGAWLLSRRLPRQAIVPTRE